MSENLKVKGKFSVGRIVVAFDPQEDMWYDAEIKDVGADDTFVVVFADTGRQV